MCSIDFIDRLGFLLAYLRKVNIAAWVCWLSGPQKFGGGINEANAADEVARGAQSPVAIVDSAEGPLPDRGQPEDD